MIIVNVYIDLTNYNTHFIPYDISYVDYNMHHSCQFRETIIMYLLVLSIVIFFPPNKYIYTLYILPIMEHGTGLILMKYDPKNVLKN